MQPGTGRPIRVVRWLLLGLIVYLLTVSLWLPKNVTAIRWPNDLAALGGWSGLEVDETGQRFWAVNDDASQSHGRLLRDSDGTLTGMILDGVGPLLGPRGQPLRRPFHDSEGLSRDAAGQFTVSFEWQHRVWRYSDLSQPATRIAPDPRWEAFRGNAGPEAVAVTDDGTLITFRERSNHVQGPERSFAHRGNGWEDGPALPPPGAWSAVGADIGPDGALYLLERRFRAIGFASRIRRLDLAGVDPIQVVYSAPVGRHGNLEGLALWQDAQGQTRATMVSDNNWMRTQRAQVVEVVLRLAPPQ